MPCPGHPLFRPHRGEDGLSAFSVPAAMPCPSPPARLVTLLLLFALLLLPAQGRSEPGLAELVRHGGFAVTAGGAILRSHNENIAFAPASTIKLVTCLAALMTLGADYRFKTGFYLDGKGILFIKGSGDPALTSEAVAGIARELARRGLKRVSGIALDASAFSVGKPADGAEGSINPYDAPNGALAVNFNSVPITVLADRTVLSGEDETPLLPIMREIGKTLAPGAYRLNPDAFVGRNPLPPTLRYAGELFAAMLARQGIKVSGRIVAARIPAGLPPFYVHSSGKTVEDLVRSCLHYSNNFLANQLFLVCGAQRHGWPATWGKGRRAMRSFIDTTWPRAGMAIVTVEGSGLSREDRITPAAMLAVLGTFAPHAGLLKTKDGIPLKSGSLSGVHCYAGYFEGDHGPDPFVILLNQQDNTRDQLLALLRTLHAERH